MYDSEEKRRKRKEQNGNKVKLTDLAYNPDGSINKFFWKVLTDRRMYDNDGNYLPQRRVSLATTQKEDLADFATTNRYGKDAGRQYDPELSRKTANEIAAEFSTSQEEPTQETKIYGGGNMDEAAEEQYAIRKEVPDIVHRIATDKNVSGDVVLTDMTPSIMLGRPGVKNLPLIMRADHIRQNILSEAEARSLGIKIENGDNFHELGETLFLQVINDLDNVRLAYRGTKKASDPTRRENLFVLFSEHVDKNGDTIIVPVYINKKGNVNRVIFPANKIASVYGKIDFSEYIAREVEKGNLVRIKKRGPIGSEAAAPIAADYAGVTSVDEAADRSAMASYDFIVDASDEKVNPFLQENEQFSVRITDRDILRTLNRSKNGSDTTQYEIRYPHYSADDVARNSVKLQKMDSIATAYELPGTGSVRDRITDFFASIGNNVFSEQFGDVELNNASVLDDFGHGHTFNKILTYSVVPDVIRNGVVIDTIQKQDTVERIIVAAPVLLPDRTEKAYVAVMLKRDVNSQRLYLHDVVTEKESATGGAVSLNTTEAVTSDSGLYTTDILLRALNVKRNFDKERKLRITDGAERYHIAAFAPILTAGDLMGSVSILAEEKDGFPGDTEQKLVQTVASFLGRHMET